MESSIEIPATPVVAAACDVDADLARLDRKAALEVRVDRNVDALGDGAQVRQGLGQVTPLSALPMDQAKPALVVASAGNPSWASTWALPRSHGLGITKQPAS